MACFCGWPSRLRNRSPEVRCDDVIVDALCMKLVLNPSEFEILLCGNLFGDIVADLCSGLVGGPSNAPSINFSGAGDAGVALFTAGHGDRAEYLCTKDSNPLPILLPAIHLLRHIGQEGEAQRLYDATASVLESGRLPKGLGGNTDRETLCAAIEAALA